MKGVIPTAAERMSCAPVGSVRSSCKKDRKFVESFGDIVLQPTPWRLGYSQLRNRIKRVILERMGKMTHSNSIPSSSYLEARLTTDLTNAVRFSAVATAVEKYWEPVQPPIDNRALTS